MLAGFLKPSQAYFVSSVRWLAAIKRPVSNLLGVNCLPLWGFKSTMSFGTKRRLSIGPSWFLSFLVYGPPLCLLGVNIGRLGGLTNPEVPCLVFLKLASGIRRFLGSKRPSPAAKPTGKGGGRHPPHLVQLVLRYEGAV